MLLWATGGMVVEYWETYVLTEMAMNIAFFRAMTTCVSPDSYQLMEKKKQQEVTMKVEAAHSSGKFVGPIYYVTSPEKSSLHFKEVRCCYFYARDKVRFVLRSRKISLIFSLESV